MKSDPVEELRAKVLPLLKPYVKRVAVFGSYARGEATPESDLLVYACVGGTI